MAELFHTSSFVFWMKLTLLVEGYTIVSSLTIYGSIGEDVLLPSPIVEGAEWFFSEINEILASCTDGPNNLTLESNRSSRLHITKNCSLKIDNLTKDDVGIYKYFTFVKDNTSSHTYDIEIKLRKLQESGGKPRVSINVFSSRNLESGQTINMSCLQKLFTKVRVDNISWYHNEKELPNTSNNILIENVTSKHAGKYKCIAENTAGESDDVVQITVNSHPNKPTDIKWFNDKSAIYLEWKAGYDGGSKQTFIVQYQKTTNGKLLFVEVESSNERIQGCFLNDLEPNTEYKLLMYAFNEFGNSTSTKEQTIFTTADMKSSDVDLEYSFLLVLLIPVCLFLIWWQLRKAKERNSNNLPAENEEFIEGGAIANNLYASANDLDWSSSTSTHRTDQYSSIERRQQMVDRQTVHYNITGKGKGKQNAGHIEFKDRQKCKTNNDQCSSKMNYIEVEFDATNPNSRFHIHGAENRNPYADIDFSLKADPLASSDVSDDGNSRCGDDNCLNDDFVSVEDVQQWNINAN